ncbi:MAG: hypothetical protein HYW88_03525, partial [Candidatus Sungbacteria bacterium]|nr:hypothetical protein [Candidatus Sungbacteria bacterium]
ITAKKKLARKEGAEKRAHIQKVDIVIKRYLSELCLTEKRLKEKMLEAASQGKNKVFFRTFEDNHWVFLSKWLPVLHRELASRQERFSKVLGITVTLSLEPFNRYYPASVCATWMV